MSAHRTAQQLLVSLAEQISRSQSPNKSCRGRYNFQKAYNSFLGETTADRPLPPNYAYS